VGAVLVPAAAPEGAGCRNSNGQTGCMALATQKLKIRPARRPHHIIVLRAAITPSVLMGQRVAFRLLYASKFVFPGGAVDLVDHDVPCRVWPAAKAASLQADKPAAPRRTRPPPQSGLWGRDRPYYRRARRLGPMHRRLRGLCATGPCAEPPTCAISFARSHRRAGPPLDARFFLPDASDLITDPMIFHPGRG